MACLSWFLVKGHLPRVSRQSRWSLMIRVIMNWSRGGCAQISWHLPYNWGNRRKTSARRPSDERAVRPFIASNWVPYLQMRSVESDSRSGMEKEGKKEIRKGGRYVVHGAVGCGQKSLKLVWQSGFLAKGQLSQVSHQSRRSLMIRVIMKWSRGCAQISRKGRVGISSG